MNENGNRYALAALKEKRASLAGEIESFKQQIAYREKQLEHVDACIGVFEPGANPEAIPNKRPAKRVKLFRQGELNRLILDALRQAHGKPQSTAQVVTAVLTAQGHQESARPALAPRVRGNLQYLSRGKGSVVKSGNARSTKWALAGDQLRLPISGAAKAD